MNSGINIIKKIFCIFDNKQKGRFVLLLLATIIYASLETIGVSVIIPVINAIMTPQLLEDNKILSYLFLLFNASTMDKKIVCVIVGVIVVYVIKNVYCIVYVWMKSYIAAVFEKELSSKMFSSYMKRGYDFFLNNNTNELIQGIGNDVNNVYVIVLQFITSITKLFVVIFIVIYLMIVDLKLAVLIVLVGCACFSVIVLCLKKDIARAGEIVRYYWIAASQVILEGIHGIKDIIVLGRRDNVIKKYEDNMEKRKKEIIKVQVGESIPAYFFEIVSIIVLLGVLYYKIKINSSTEVIISTMSVFAVGAMRILPAIATIVGCVNLIVAHRPSLDNVYENLEIVKRDSSIISPLKKGFTLEFTNNIVLHDVSFSYSGRERDILKKVNVSIEKNQSVAFVGESGCGKSTLIDIILGLLKVSEGKVLIDGTSINKIADSWQNIIGYVSQSIYLSDTTIRENVAYGLDEDIIDDDKVYFALKRASLYEFVNGLPEGIYTKVGDRGIRLSGGQIQRIGIARALYSDPKVLILDEATSALDTETERAIMESVDRLRGKITIIIVAHRLSTIKNCDVIYKITEGNVCQVEYNELS